MSELDFSDIDVLLVDPSLNNRTMLANIMRDNGFNRMRYARTLGDVEDAFAEAMPDLMICEADIPIAGFCDMIYRLRHHDLGSNPFMPVIALTWTPERETVRMVIDSGADDLLVRPLSASQLMARIKTLTLKRKPFVVTSDYIGPDRRTDSRDSKIPRVEVPNILAHKARHERVDVRAIQDEITRTVKEVNLQKLERHSVQIEYLIKGIVPNLEKGVDDEVTQRMLDRLLYVAEDTARRLGGTKYDHVSELCQSLIKVTSTLLATKDKTGSKEIRLLTPLASAIRTGFDTTRTVAEAAREISKNF
jgi:DNA-binding response OmpR family regulator